MRGFYLEEKEKTGRFGYEKSVAGSIRFGGKTAPRASMDDADAGAEMGEDDGDLDIADEEEERKEIQSHNKKFFEAHAKITQEFPRSQLRYGKKVKIAKDLPKQMKSIKKKNVITPVTPSGIFIRDKTVSVLKYMQQQRKKNIRAKKTNESIKRKFQNKIEAYVEHTNATSQKISQNQTKLNDFMTNYIEKRQNVSEKRDIMGSHYYLPKNCTGKSVQAMLSSAESEVDSLRYGCPLIGQIEALSLSQGFKYLEDFEQDIRNGELAKNAKDVKKAMASEEFGADSGTSHSFSSNNYLELMENDLARKKYLSTEDYGDIYEIEEGIEGVGDEQVQERELRLLSNFEKHSKALFIYTPFKYSVRYTYKLLYYHYMNAENLILPFGRTCPDSTWLMIFSLYLDPQNILGTRLGAGEYALRLGGVGLLEKTIFSKQSDIVEFKKIYQPIMNKSIGKNYSNDIVSTCLVNMIRINRMKTKLSEIKDEIHEVYAKTSDDFQNIKDNYKRGGFNQKEISLKFNVLENLLDKILSLETRNISKKEMMNMISIPYDSKRIRLKSVLIPISFQIVSFAAEIDSIVKKAKNNMFDCDQWFIQMIEDAIVNRRGVMALFLDIYKDENYSGVMKYLFKGEKNASTCIAFVSNIHDKLTKDGIPFNVKETRYTGMTSNMSKDLIYCKLSAKIKKASNPKLFKYIMLSIDDKKEGNDSTNIEKPTILEEIPNMGSFADIESEADVESNTIVKPLNISEFDDTIQSDIIDSSNIFDYPQVAEENEVERHILFKNCVEDTEVRKGFIERSKAYWNNVTFVNRPKEYEDMFNNIVEEYLHISDRSSGLIVKKLRDAIYESSIPTLEKMQSAYNKVSRFLYRCNKDEKLDVYVRNMAGFIRAFMFGLNPALKNK